MRVRHLISAAIAALLALMFVRARWTDGYERGFRALWRTGVRLADAATERVGDLGSAMPGVGASRSPVLLVGGYANDERAVGAITRSLRRDGFDAYTMTLPEFGMGDILEQGVAIRRRVSELRASTGADVVNVVGFSSGGYAARAAAQLDGSNHGIGRVVTLACGNGGLDFWPVNWIVDRISPYGVRQVRTGSDLIRRLHATRGRADVVSIGTHGLDLIIPNPAAYRIPGKPYLVVDEGRRLGPVSRVHHAAITRDHHTYETIRGALLGQGGALVARPADEARRTGRSSAGI